VRNPRPEDVVLEATVNIHTKECKWFPVCPMKRFYEARKLSEKWIKQYCKGDWNTCIRYHLEERGEMHPDWMLPDGTIDEDLRQF